MPFEDHATSIVAEVRLAGSVDQVPYAKNRAHPETLIQFAKVKQNRHVIGYIQCILTLK